MDLFRPVSPGHLNLASWDRTPLTVPRMQLWRPCCAAARFQDLHLNTTHHATIEFEGVLHRKCMSPFVRASWPNANASSFCAGLVDVPNQGCAQVSAILTAR
jgi:hypothetical protein